MTNVTYASGTQTASIGTEHFLSSPNAVGDFQLHLDLSNMAAGDVLEVRAYKMTIASGTSRPMWFYAFYGAQPDYADIVISAWVSNALTDTNAVRFSITQTFGTGRDYDWNVLERTDAASISGTPTNFNLLAIDGSGRVDVSLIEGSDATNQIRDSILNDATRFAGANIDAAITSRPSAAANADAVWDEVLAGHLTAGSTGAALNAAGGAGDPWITPLPGAYTAGQAGYIIGNNVDATISSRSTLNGAGVQSALTSQGYTTTRAGYLDTLNGLVAAVWANVTRTLTAGTNIVLTKGVGLTGLNDVSTSDVSTAAQSALTSQGYTTTRAGYLDVLNGILAAIWANVTRTLTAGTNIVLAKGTGLTGLNDLSAAQVNTEADTALVDAGVTPARQAHLDADVSSRMATFVYTAPDNATITAINAKTTNLPASPASEGNVTAVGNAVAALNDISPSQVNAEVVDALSVDAYAEPGSIPAASTSLAAKIGFVYAFLRNKKTNNGVVKTLRNDADSGSIGTSAISDDGTTFTENEWS